MTTLESPDQLLADLAYIVATYSWVIPKDCKAITDAISVIREQHLALEAMCQMEQASACRAEPTTPAREPEAGVNAEMLHQIIAGCEGVQGGPWKLDKFACYIWAPSEKGGDFPVMDAPGENGRVVRLRGWGYYTGSGHGAIGLPPSEAEHRQRLTGEHIARLDPQTVRSICLDLLARREAASHRVGRGREE